MCAAQRIGSSVARCHHVPTGSNAMIPHSLRLDFVEEIAPQLCEPARVEREETLSELFR
jgi:hypothetical protein